MHFITIRVPTVYQPSFHKYQIGKFSFLYVNVLSFLAYLEGMLIDWFYSLLTNTANVFVLQVQSISEMI